MWGKMNKLRSHKVGIRNENRDIKSFKRKVLVLLPVSFTKPKYKDIVPFPQPNRNDCQRRLFVQASNSNQCIHQQGRRNNQNNSGEQ